MNIKKIEDYQLKELADEKLYINKYDMSLLYDYEINIFWKEFFFNMLQELALKHTMILKKDDKELLFDYFKKEYYNIIKEYELNIDILDYVEITDYITLDEWNSIEGNGIAYFNDGIYLIKK